MPEIKTISAIRALVQRGMPLLAAKRAIERAMEQGETTIVVEGDDFAPLIIELSACGFFAGTVPAA